MRRWAALVLLLALLLAGCAPRQADAPPSPASSEPSAPVESAPTEPSPSAELSPEPSPSEELSPEPPPSAELSPEPPPSEELSPEPTLPEESPAPVESEPAPEPEDGDFVLVSDYIPNLHTALAYATPENFTGQVIYDFDTAWLRYGTVKKLAAAAELLAEEGYALLIWDAFRPTAAQFRLWEVYPDGNFVANPTKGFSSHSRGNTVDLTLALPDGTPAELPSGFDEFSALADRDYSDASEAAAANARLLEDVMERCGFRGYSAEWWHYSDRDSYPVEETFTPPEN